MKSLIKIMLTLTIIFATTFVIAKSTGIITVEKIQIWLEGAQELSPLNVVTLVIVLLFADLFIAVSTLTVTILSGYFLGHILGASASILGLLLAGLTGYGLSYAFGDKILRFLVKNDQEREQACTSFRQHGVTMILLSRAVPILPEVTACMAGTTQMSFFKFLLAWVVSTVPYALIASYAGSISSLDNPKPAILTAIGLTAFFWVGWFLFRKSQRV